MSVKQRILIVEDERNISNYISTILTANGFDVIAAKDGNEAYTLVRSHCPDLVLLDLGLPDMDGMSIIRKVREWSRLPIIVVSARTQEGDKVLALDAGADDYITKPFGTSELLARIRTAVRHTHAANCDVGQSGTLTIKEMKIDYDSRRVYISGEDAHLTQNEFKLVCLLARYAGRVLTYDYIIKELWGPSACGDNQILRVNMANIRRKIEKNPATPEYILTEVGVGYRMIEGG
ncbi:MAG: response regulator transcription factor [Ruminococcaceae bacterium]|jgi:two-component system KDP operon response regulator KdpE|nr:response regulator transcription factor [Oscillospiraceae bacterium]